MISIFSSSSQISEVMNREDFKKRTKEYALRVIRLVESLPEERVSRILGDQLLRAGTSVGANYRSSIRAKSRADFISKMNVVEEECDESLYWMELLIAAGKVAPGRLDALMQEGDEIVSIVVASIKTARSRA
ncbi:MAG: four helix bundle protein [Opitutaceae bacterium]